jgi:nitrate/nitrite-specific signal transduction histidine kinase
MRERAALIGGRLWIRSAPGKGTDVRLSAPVSFDLAKPLIGSEW